MAAGPAVLDAPQRKSLDAERHVAWVRFFLVAFNIVSYYVWMYPGGQARLAMAVSIAAGAYGIFLVTFRPYERIKAMQTAQFTVVADSVLIFAWLAATGAGASPYVYLWWVSLAAVAFRFGHKATLVATAVYVVLDVIVCAITPGPSHIYAVATRVAYLIFMGAIGAFMAHDAATAYARGSHAKMALEVARRDARRKEVEEARWRALADASLEGLALHRGGSILEANHALAVILGRSQKALIGFPLWDIIDESSRQEAETFLAGPMGRVAELAVNQPDGETRIVEIKTHDPERGDGTQVLAVRDVTEAKRSVEMRRLTEEQDVQIRRLQAVDRFKTDFINTAAHELNTPLTPLMIQLKVLRRSIDEAASEAHMRSVNILERNLKRLAGIVADMMDVARLQAGRLHVEKTPMDLSNLVQAEMEVYAGMADEQGIEFNADIDPCIEVEADPKRTSQVISNFLSNALKFTGRGGRIDVVVRKGDDGARVAVMDTGVGLSEEQRCQLFQPFVRVHDTAGGTGLGLYIARSLAEAMGCKIDVQSDGPGRGATFDLVIPATVVVEAP